MKILKKFQKRLNSLRKKIIQRNLSAFLVSNPINVFYLTGFLGFSPKERESFLFVDKKMATLYLPKIYEAEAPNFKGLKVKIVFEWRKIFKEILKRLKKYRGKIGFEAENLNFNEYLLLKKGISFFPKKDFVNELRRVKEDEEILNIKKAVEITDLVFEKILRFIKPGLTEKQISSKIRKLIETFGGDGIAFEPIVAFGKKTSRPHYFSNNKKLKKGEPILLDFGAKFKNYCSDFTRTIYFGRAPILFKERYKIVKEAQEMAFKIIKPGLKAEDLYNAVKENLGKEAKYFIHAAGHGIGLESHEKPHLKKSSKEILKAGEILSIEPGIYYPGKYGIRIEDCGLITKKGFKILSKSPRDLIEI
jgi:Xaa-Pro aminopeptidase